MKAPAPPLHRTLRIGIASTGRFHVLDLARELRALGHEVTFYSYVSPARAEKFGFAASRMVSLMPAVAPFLVWERFLPGVQPGLRTHRYFAAINRAMIRRMSPCDVFICMSGIYVEAAKHARAAFGAKVFLERGSMHINAQLEILRRANVHPPMSALTRTRELAGYALADRIVLPSLHVEQSFAHDAAAFAKTFMNPYGVDLGLFTKRPSVPPLRRRLLFVGGWSYRKGVDFLVEAVRRTPGATLTHVGAIVDAPFPDDPSFTHVDPVDQTALPAYYRDADLFALASREDGLALVLLQALASGLPCIASDHTGGSTLVAFHPELSRLIRVHKVSDVNAMSRDIQWFFDTLERSQLELITDVERDSLSWAAYGKRYEDEILSVLEGN